MGQKEVSNHGVNWGIGVGGEALFGEGDSGGSQSMCVCGGGVAVMGWCEGGLQKEAILGVSLERPPPA